MNKFMENIRGAESIAISGHIKPDGDCIGACMAMYHYLRNNWKNKKVKVYLDGIPEIFRYIEGWEEADVTFESAECDLFLALDCGDLERLGKARPLFHKARRTLNIDHHVTNTNFADYNHVEPHASATCEILFGLFDKDKIPYAATVCLYTGIIHDTGVLKYPNTTKRTLQTVGELIDRGIPFTKIIDESFYQKTYVQNQILGRCLLESVMILNGRCLFTMVTRKMLKFYGALSNDLEGVVEQLRITKGVEVAILLYELDSMEYKVSMRSKDVVDVSKIAAYFGGGGHLRAAGCMMSGTMYDALNNLTKLIEKELS